MRKWRKWILYAAAVVIGLMILIAILQAAGIMPSNEEFGLTDTMEAQTQVAQAAIATIDQATSLASITPSLTPTVTPTALPTATPQPSPTPGPEDMLSALVDSVVTGDVISVGFTPDLMEMHADWQLSENFLGSDSSYAGREMLRIACKIKEDGAFAGYVLSMSAWVDVIDTFGNEDTIIGVNAILTPQTIERINCANVELLEIADIADQFIVHPVVD